MIRASWSVSIFPAIDWLHQRTFRSSCKSWEFSMTSDKTGLHFDASLTRAKICFGGDLWLWELKIRDFNEPDA